MVAAAVGELRLAQYPRANQTVEVLRWVGFHERAVVPSEAGVKRVPEWMLSASGLSRRCTGRHFLRAKLCTCERV